MGHYKHIKGIFFDMDGTILNSEPLHTDAIKELLEEFDIKVSHKKLSSLYNGIADNDIYSSLIQQYPQLSKKIELTQFLKRKNELLIDLIEKLTNSEVENIITPGLIPILNKFKREGKKMALVSASEPEIVHSTVKKLGIQDFFSIIEARQEDIPTKPSPAPYQIAMKKLSLSKDETLIFEDSLTGLQSAHKSGAHVIQITAFCSPQSKIYANSFKSL